MSANDKTIKRIRKILESQLELLSTKGPDQISHTELGGIARTLFDVIKREEAALGLEPVQRCCIDTGALKILNVKRHAGHEEPLPFDTRCVIGRHAVTGRCVDDR